jgi:hypothetical protein
MLGAGVGGGEHLVAPAVGKADIADVLDVVGLHVFEHHRHHQRKRLRVAERVGLLGGIVVVGRHRDHRHLRLVRERGDRRVRCRQRRADEGVDVIFRYHLLRDGEGGVGVGRVVADDVFHLLAADLGGEEVEGALVAHPHRRGRPADRQDGADLDLRLCPRRRTEKPDRRGDREQTRFHATLPAAN